MAKGTLAKADRVLYFDLDKSGVPASDGDVIAPLNEDAVSASLLNILETEPNSRVYKQRTFGAGLEQYLFEPIDITTAQRILETIETSISQFEPRARKVVVTVTPLVDENTFIIEITANIDESTREIELDTTLEKLR